MLVTGSNPVRQATLLTFPMTTIKPGCVINTPDHGHAVCVAVEPEYVQYRYFAERCSDNAPIWVLNGCQTVDVTWVANGNAISRAVAAMTGPYGEGDD